MTIDAQHATVSAITVTASSPPLRGLRATVIPFIASIALTAISGLTSNTPSANIKNRPAIPTVTTVKKALHVKVRWITTGGLSTHSNARSVGKSLRVRRQKRHIDELSGIELALYRHGYQAGLWTVAAANSIGMSRFSWSWNSSRVFFLAGGHSQGWQRSWVVTLEFCLDIF